MLLSLHWKDTDQPAILGYDWLLSEFTSLELLLEGKVLYCRKVADLGLFSVELEEHMQNPTVCKFINLFYLTQKPDHMRRRILDSLDIFSIKLKVFEALYGNFYLGL